LAASEFSAVSAVGSFGCFASSAGASPLAGASPVAAAASVPPFRKSDHGLINLVTIFSPMPGISINCSGVIPASFSTELIPPLNLLDGLRANARSDVNGVVGAVSAVICLFDPGAFFLALDVRCPADQLACQAYVLPFLPMASESCESSTITSSFCSPDR